MGPVRALLFLLLFQCPVSAAAVAELFTAEDFSVSNHSLGKTSVALANDLSMLSVNPAAVNSNYYMSGYLFQKLGSLGANTSFVSYAFQGWGYNFAASSAFSHPVAIEEINDFGESVATGSSFDFFFSGIVGDRFQINNPVLGGTYEFGAGIRIFYTELFEATAVTAALDGGIVHRRKIKILQVLPNNKNYNVSIGGSLGKWFLSTFHTFSYILSISLFLFISGSTLPFSLFIFA